MKGIYVLVISLNRNISLDIGALGTVSFDKGLYAYVGSAQNNLEKRIVRHHRKVKKKFWHIDYLLSNRFVEVVTVLCMEADRSVECRIAGKLGRKGNAVKHFECSDCSCVTHLFRVEDSGFLSDFMSSWNKEGCF